MPHCLVSNLLESPCGTAQNVNNENKAALTYNYCSWGIFCVGTHPVPPAPMHVQALVMVAEVLCLSIKTLYQPSCGIVELMFTSLFYY